MRGELSGRHVRARVTGNHGARVSLETLTKGRGEGVGSIVSAADDIIPGQWRSTRSRWRAMGGASAPHVRASGERREMT